MQVAIITAIVGAVSGFMNNVGALALLLPIRIKEGTRQVSISAVNVLVRADRITELIGTISQKKHEGGLA